MNATSDRRKMGHWVNLVSWSRNIQGNTVRIKCPQCDWSYEEAYPKHIEQGPIEWHNHFIKMHKDKILYPGLAVMQEIEEVS